MRTGLYLGEVPIGKVVVAVAGEGGIQLQTKTVIPSKDASIEVTPDTGIDGLSKVTVERIPDIYIDTTTNKQPRGEDMLKGTIAFANGEEIEGELEDKNSLNYTASSLSFENGDLTVGSTNTEKAIIQAGANVSITVDGASLGNATEANVLSGKTFTSENGLIEKGTMANNGEINAILNSTTPYKDIPIGYAAGGRVSLGENVVDTTISINNEAQAEHILSGKKAYANSELITGTIPIISTLNKPIATGATVNTNGSIVVQTAYTPNTGYNNSTEDVTGSTKLTNVFTTETWTLTKSTGGTSRITVVTI